MSEKSTNLNPTTMLKRPKAKKKSKHQVQTNVSPVRQKKVAHNELPRSTINESQQ